MKNHTGLIDFLKGLTLGAGMLPGVSMGSVGFFVNVYEKLVNGVRELKSHFKKAFKTIFPILLGMLLSSVVVAIAVYFLFGFAPFVIVCVCAGLTIGCMPILVIEIKNKRLSATEWLRMAGFFVLASSLGIISLLGAKYGWFSMTEAFKNPNQNAWIYIVVPLVCLVGGFACMIPGISGSMILFVAGMYSPLINLFISSDSVPSIFKDPSRLSPGLLITFEAIVGIIVGIVIACVTMSKSLEKHRRGTFVASIGLVAGSVVAMFANNETFDEFYKNFNTSTDLWQFIVGGITLVVLSVAFIYITKRKLKADNNDNLD